jgi:hypothetical protein
MIEGTVNIHWSVQVQSRSNSSDLVGALFWGLEHLWTPQRAELSYIQLTNTWCKSCEYSDVLSIFTNVYIPIRGGSHVSRKKQASPCRADCLQRSRRRPLSQAMASLTTAEMKVPSWKQHAAKESRGCPRCPQAHSPFRQRPSSTGSTLRAPVRPYPTWMRLVRGWTPRPLLGGCIGSIGPRSNLLAVTPED